MATSPSKTANYFWNMPQDLVSSKTGMTNLNFEKTFLYGQYQPNLAIVGAATKFSDFWMGIEYKGQFADNNYNKYLWKATATDSKKNHLASNAYNMENEILFTGHLPFALPMGFQVGFNIGGTYGKSYRTIGNTGEFGNIDPPDGQLSNYNLGISNHIIFTPALSYAVKVPLEERFALTPSITIKSGFAPNTETASYKDSSGNVSAKRHQLRITPDITLDLEFSWAGKKNTSYLAGLEYNFAGDFGENEITKWSVGNANNEREIKAAWQVENNIALRYRQTTNFTDRLRMAWQVKANINLRNRFWPGEVVKTQSYNEVYPDTYMFVGGSKTRSGSTDRFVYNTDIFFATFAPIANIGLQYDLKPEKVIFGLGIEVIPFMFEHSYYDMYIGADLGGNKNQARTLEETTQKLNKFSAKFSTGFSIYFTPQVMLDTGLNIEISNTSSKVSFDDIWKNSNIQLALGVSL